MLHHISFAVRDVSRSAAFYDAVLIPLGFRRVAQSGGFVGYGRAEGEDQFALKEVDGDIAIPGTGFHLAFAAPSRAAVDDFYRAALNAGGRDNGPAGLRPHYGPAYYAAFVFDPDGYRIEAVVNDAD